MEELYRKYEEQQLHELIYEEFSEDWTQKRRKPWYDLEIELQKMIHEKFRVGLDAGCGSGRNVPILLKHADVLICLDISPHQISALKENIINQKNKKIDTQIADVDEIQINPIVGDIMHPPFRLSSFDLIASVSTIHHIQGRSNRIHCLNALIDILCDRGLIFYTVWRFDIPRFKAWFDWQTTFFSSSSHQNRQKLMNEAIEFGDIIVPWTLSKLDKIFYRYYHVFTEDTLTQEIEMLKDRALVKIRGFPEEKKDNFLIFAKKQRSEL